ncbi:MAG: uroporphyrinogen decarboxylase family protein [Oscillospiraceae bacterium]|nr:uroporphyrinogen decarboxylase family protein [Oscillospiraceae bacterium]
MTGKEKIQAAFSKEGTDKIPAVLCYEGIYIRDHWKQLTSCPWWYANETDLDRQIQWHSEVIANIGQDWFALPRGSASEYSIVERTDGVFKIDKRTQKEVKLNEPKISDCYQEWHRDHVPTTREEIDNIFRDDIQDDITEIKRNELPDKLLNLYPELCPLAHVASPLQDCVSIWGFEGFMLTLHDNPELIEYTCELVASLMAKGIYELKIRGVEAVWIEECYIDMISPEMFGEFNVPYITRVVEMIRENGMKSVYYHTGDPWKKLDLILGAGADAISFEESKKGFTIDIEDIVDAVQGRCTVLGNLNATTFLPVCTEDELQAEIKRQIAAGRKNKNRFIMSMGSPVTPGTSVEKVRLYCDIAHEIGG